VENAKRQREAQRAIDLRDQTVVASDTTDEIPAPATAAATRGTNRPTAQDRIRAEVRDDRTMP
jgi:hypothetical protein